MTPTAERLDRLIDALNAGDRSQIAALLDEAPDLADLYATARQLRDLRGTVRPPPPAGAELPPARRASRRRLRALGGLAATIALLAIVGVGLSLALANARDRSRGDVAGVTPPAASPAATVASPSPQPTAIPPASPAQAWSALVQPLGALNVGGAVALRPLPSGEYEAAVIIYGTDQNFPWPLRLGLGRGSCAAPPQPSSTSWLREAATTGARVNLVVARAWLDDPLVVVAWPHSGAPPIACADLPVAAARARQPRVDSGATTAAIAPQPGWHITGTTVAAPTASGDVVLFVEVAGPDDEFALGRGGARLLWHLIQGSCADLQRPDRFGLTAVLYRENPGSDRPGHQSFTLIVKREWAHRPLALAAYGEGGGPLIACGDPFLPGVP